MISPAISLVVVINGPVATAGSIFNLLSTIGTKVPNNEANMITVNKDTLTDKES